MSINKNLEELKKVDLRKAWNHEADDFTTWLAQEENLSLLSDEEIPGWTFAYSRPADCHTPREIVDRINYGTPLGISGDYDNNVQYEECIGTTTDTKVIATDQENAQLKYTKKITDVNLFDATFKEALISKLASDLAMPLKGKLDLQQAWARGFQAILDTAKRINANKDNRPAKPKSTIVSSRR